MTVFQVSHPAVWTVVGGTERLPSIMRWTSADPVAVQISFGDSTGVVDWILARDLLADVAMGKLEESGVGDVKATRTVNHGLAGPTADQLVLTLSVGHVIKLRTDLNEVRFFLEATFMYVKQGEENIDIDLALTKLLDDGWTSGV